MTHARRLSDNVSLPATRGRILVAALSALAIGAGALTWSRWASDPRRWLFSYLTALVFVITISIGAVAWLMLQHLTRAVWSVVIRRLLENLTRPLPLLAVGFVPIAVNLPRIYSWADASRVAADPALARKAAGWTRRSSMSGPRCTWRSGPSWPGCWRGSRPARTRRPTRVPTIACGT